MIRHLVAVRFRADITAAEKAAIFDELGALKGHIKGISDYQVRRNVSVEDAVVHGFRDLFWFDFNDTDVRDTYLVDPAHQAAGARLVALSDGGTDGIFVCDFEV